MLSNQAANADRAATDPATTLAFGTLIDHALRSANVSSDDANRLAESLDAILDIARRAELDTDAVEAIERLVANILGED